MSWEINFNYAQRIIELRYAENVTPKELEEAFTVAIDMSKREATKKFLADCTNLSGGHSVVDLYSLIDLFASKDLRGMKEALLLPTLQTSRQNVEFYETACLNRGFSVKIFSNYQEALEWLVK